MRENRHFGKEIGTLSKGIAGEANIEVKFDVSKVASETCNFSSAKRVSATIADNNLAGAVQVDMSKAAAPDYRYRYSRNSPAAAPSTTHGSARIIRDCQLAFAAIMKSIGNPAAVYRPRAHNEVGMTKTRESTMQIMPPDTRMALQRQMAVTEFGMRWEPGRQFFYGAGKVFANAGVTQTVPTHDLAHLMIGACGNLEWCPEGGDRDVRLAEYYAVFLENLFDKIYGHMVVGSFEAERTLHESIEYARWFVEVHYAPFPLPAEEAYRRFCWNLDIDAAVRLSPLFFALKSVERTFPQYRDQIWELHFNTGDAPRAEDMAFAEKPAELPA